MGSPVGSLGVAAGVLLGGALTTWAGWQTIFWINAPIGAVALLAGVKVIPQVRTPRVSLNQFDVAGAATVIGSLVAPPSAPAWPLPVRSRHHPRHPARQARLGPRDPPHRCHRPHPRRCRGVLLAQASAGASFASGILPGLAVTGLGVGMVFVPVSVTAMAGIPAQHAGLASGFLMTGHEVGAALGVAVLSAVASTAGNLHMHHGPSRAGPRRDPWHSHPDGRR